MAQQIVDFFDDRDDAALLASARAGDGQSADVLWVRVRPAAVRVAYRIAGNSHDAEDLASEALAKVFAAIAEGQGPTQSLLPYVCTTMRNLHLTALRRTARSGGTVELDEERVLELVSAEDAEEETLESEFVANAFKNLPARWRHVLWASLVEGRAGNEIADDLGIKPAAVHALKARALEGLRQRYLTEHAKPGLPAECAEVHLELAAVARGRLRKSADLDEIWRHLRSCEHCAEGYREISAMNNRIGALLGPAAIGMIGVLPRHWALGPLGALRAASPAAQWGVAAGAASVLAATATVAVTLSQPPPTSPEATRAVASYGTPQGPRTGVATGPATGTSTALRSVPANPPQPCAALVHPRAATPRLSPTPAPCAPTLHPAPTPGLGALTDALHTLVGSPLAHAPGLPGLAAPAPAVPAAPDLPAAPTARVPAPVAPLAPAPTALPLP